MNFVAVGICFQFDFFHSLPRSSRMSNTADLETASEWSCLAEFSATDTSDGSTQCHVALVAASRWARLRALWLKQVIQNGGRLDVLLRPVVTQWQGITKK